MMRTGTEATVMLSPAVDTAVAVVAAEVAAAAAAAAAAAPPVTEVTDLHAN